MRTERVKLSRKRIPSCTPTGRYTTIEEQIHGLEPSLDIGCKYNPVGDLGIDIDRGCHPQIVADGAHLPFRDASFQAVVLAEVLEHLPRGTEGKVLGEIRRVLRAGGRLVLSTPKRCLLNRLSDPPHYLVDHRHYSAIEVAELVTEAGFSRCRIVAVGGFWNAAWSAWYYSLWSLFGIQVPRKVVQEADRELVNFNSHGTTLVAIADALAASGRSVSWSPSSATSGSSFTG